MEKRITIRFNDRETADLDLLKRTYKIDKDSEAVKLAVEWVNSYLKNVTNTFFPPNFDLVLVKKIKTGELKRKVYD
jgi:hypothetical protein